MSCLVLAALCGPGYAQPAQTDAQTAKQENSASGRGVLLADYGIYRADVSASLPVAADIELQKKTYRVPLKPGELFGIRFVPVADVDELAVAVRISHPAQALPMGANDKKEDKTGTPETESGAIQSYTHTRTLQPGQLYFEGLRITDSPLFVPGAYTFEILLSGKVQFSRTFELYQERTTESTTDSTAESTTQNTDEDQPDAPEKGQTPESPGASQ